MVDDVEDDIEELEDGEDEEGGKKKKKLAGKTLVLFIILPILGLAVIGFGAMKFFGGGDAVEEHVAEQQEVTPALQDPTQVNFVDLEEILVNIRTNDNSPTFLSMTVSLEINKDEDEKVLRAAMPRIDDKFQVYLKELRLEDLTGAAGTQRVKEELLRRVNIAAAPVKVNAVLIREMVVQ